MRATRLCLVSSFVLGCGGPSPTAGGGSGDDDEVCSDVDGDGYGTGAACRGPDCDDRDAHIWDASACAQRCEAEEVATGCTCDAVEPVTCYTGAAETLGIGRCASGLRTCEDGRWSPCVGEALPLSETCNDVDDDCDGETDEAPCDSSASCDTDCVGPDVDCARWGEDRTGEIVEDASGALTLGGSTSGRHVIWPSSGATGQVMRVSTETKDIEAVFWSGPLQGTGGFSGLNTGESPSRTAVTSTGDAIIANRTPGGWNSITKFAADSSTCPDVNGDGVLETSSGIGDVLPFDAADSWSDECILWHTVVGDSVDSFARALSVHRSIGLDGVIEENGWVGLWRESKFQEFDVETGELTGDEAPTPGFAPYSSSIDREGIVWVGGGDLVGGVSVGGHVGRFDTADPDDSWETLDVDGTGKRVIIDENDVPWFAGQRDLWRYDADSDALERVPVYADARDRLAEQFGIFASDGAGSIWIAVWNQEKVYRVSNEDEPEIHEVATPGTPGFGVDADFDGQIWVFGWSRGSATVIDVDDESTELTFEQCGGPCGDYMYMRGDLAGLHMKNSQGDLGSWSTVFEGCDSGETEWSALTVDRTVPVGATFTLVAQSADDLVSLAGAPTVSLPEPDADGEIDVAGAFSAAGVETGGLLSVRAGFRSSGDGAPTLRQLAAEHCCETVLE